MTSRFPFPPRSRTLCLVFLLGCLVLPLDGARAAAYTLRPDDTVESDWSATRAGSTAAVDDPVLQPNAPPTGGDYLSARTAGRAAEFGVEGQSLAPGDTVLSTTAWAYVATGESRSVTITLLAGDTVLGSNTVPAGMAPTWHTVPSSSGLTQEQVDDLQVRVSLNGEDGPTTSYVYATYVSLQTEGVLTARVSASPTFSATLDGTDRVATYTSSLNIADTRDTAGGWHLSVAATKAATDGPVTRTLPANASSVTSVASTCAADPCSDPLNALSYPVAIPAGGAPVKFFSADSGSGSGRFTITPTTSVSIPANADAGAFSSTVTYTLANGP